MIAQTTPRRAVRLALAGALLAVLLAGQTPGVVHAATERYVDAARGFDTIPTLQAMPPNDCLTFACKTIAHAVSVAGAGDILHLAGAFHEHAILLDRALTLSGMDQPFTVVDGDGAARVFEVNAWATVTLTGLAITGGQALGDGAAIENRGALSLSHCDVHDNHSGDGGRSIGNAAGGTLAITDSAIRDNDGGIANAGGAVTVIASAVVGNVRSGGLTNSSGGAMSVTNSTIARNTTALGGDLDSSGGGIRNAGDSTLVITQSTVAFNTANGPNGGYGGGVFNAVGGTVQIGNSLVALNGAFDFNPGNGPNIAGALDSRGNNLFGDTTSGSGYLGTDLQNVTDPGFQTSTPVRAGATFVLPLVASSPAIDKIPVSSASCPATDQRGVARPQGPACDIGAFEFESAPVLIALPPGITFGPTPTPTPVPLTIPLPPNVYFGPTPGPGVINTGGALTPTPMPLIIPLPPGITFGIPTPTAVPPRPPPVNPNAIITMFPTPTPTPVPLR